MAPRRGLPISRRRGGARGSGPNGNQSSTNSGVSTPQNGEDMSSTTSETGSLESLPARELPPDLIGFVAPPPVNPDETIPEPPRKKRKTIVEPSASPELEHIVVKESVWDIECGTSRLSGYDLPLRRSNILPYVHWKDSNSAEFIEIRGDRKRTLFHTPLPSRNDLKDVHLALLVDKQTKRWGNEQGKLWTQFGIELFQRNDLDVIRLTFTVRWNTTPTPYHTITASKKTLAVSSVLKEYFPDPSVKAEKWSAQDFYQSVHTPEKDDEVAASVKVEDLKADLYPFQKRAVQWMLRKEGAEWSRESGGLEPSAPAEPSLPNSFLRVKDHLGKPCFISHLFGVVTLDIEPFVVAESRLRGGILSEEMGLGKTVEMISLMLLHQRKLENTTEVYDTFTGENVRPTGATLIISPPSILPQWISEIHSHAPSLKVTHYEGTNGHSKLSPSELLDTLATSDVVISTYAILAAEINFTQLNPEKRLRNESKYPRPKCPLMMLSWWRCVMDEAQMIESGVSNAAIVARLIPRVNAWCVTGTPVRRDVNDILGLLVFLRCEPYASFKHVWISLITAHKQNFQALIRSLALRHSKRSVRDELKLPAQKRYVITMPFTPIEEQHYQELCTQMCAELGLDAQGAPTLDNWDLDEATEAMRSWLVRLRQTALHPQVGGRNRRALGHRDGPLRTIDQVLEIMIEQTEISIRVDQRTLFLAKLKRGQLFENSPRVKEALTIWDEVAHEIATIVEDCREQVRQELQSKADEFSSKDNEADGNVPDEEDVDPSSKLGVSRARLRNALDVQHVATFFRANAYFQIKSNEEFTAPDSQEFKDLEKLETDGYEEAKKLRQEILQDIVRKVDVIMHKISRTAETQGFATIPEFSTNPPQGGLESRRIIERLDELAEALDAQANQLDEWREQTIQLLLRPLVDEDEEREIQGDEYEESTKTQDEVMVYVQALRAVIADRHDALTGQINLLVSHEAKVSLQFANKGEGPFPKKTIELLSIRSQVKPDADLGSVRGFVTELRALATTLRTDAEKGNPRAQNELMLVEIQLAATQKKLTAQTKVANVLEKEIDLFTNTMNARVDYYRQLQGISDMVAPYEDLDAEGLTDEEQARIRETTLRKLIDQEGRLANKVAAAKSKRRYLEHLRMESANPTEQRLCVICKEEFEVGALTVCGHQYCSECIRLWWNSHRNCPMCKKKLVSADLHEITYKPQELSLHTDSLSHSQSLSPQTNSFPSKSKIYSSISKTTLDSIKKIELSGPSFTTKIDTLARHLIYLRESDPGAKSIIFSQFKDFLNVLAQAFQKFRISFESIDKQNGIERFKEDPSVECFLLHARAHASGLNLVNANHVFLCEPLLNTALELQAIARVDRIGQRQETNVWLYLVDGTVEESIYELSVKRRMEHMEQHGIGKGKGKEKRGDLGGEGIGGEMLDDANSEELLRGGLKGLLAKDGGAGEMVQKGDLWECLFGGKRREKGAGTGSEGFRVGLEREVGRELRGVAAEERREQGGNV